jgi:hypothetical protein
MAAVRQIQTPCTNEFGGVYIFEWTLTSADTDGEAIRFPRYADRSIHFSGTWGGATATIEGTNLDNTAFAVLTNQSAVAITATADDISVISEPTLWIRPRLSTAGTGATVTARLLVRRLS